MQLFFWLNTIMTTEWAYASTITQYAEVLNHISWKDDGMGFYQAMYPDGIFLETTSPLLHIANSLVNDVKNKTYYLSLTGFNLINIPASITGLEVAIEMNRGGRITDETIQLAYNGQLIGNNKANGSLDPYKIYGDATDLWGVNLTNVLLNDPNFGIILRFQSHPRWPHKTSPLIDAVEIRIH